MADGRWQKDRKLGNSDSPLIVEPPSAAKAGVLNPKSSKEEERSNLLPSALKLLPSRAKPDRGFSKSTIEVNKFMWGLRLNNLHNFSDPGLSNVGFFVPGITP